MLLSQKNYIEWMKRGKTAEEKAAAAAADKKSHAELNAMRAKHSECFDCSAKKPGWAVLPHGEFWRNYLGAILRNSLSDATAPAGVFVCIDCAQVHRNMGRHISRGFRI